MSSYYVIGLRMEDREENALLLQPYGEKGKIEQLVEELNQLPGVMAKYLDLNEV